MLGLSSNGIYELLKVATNQWGTFGLQWRAGKDVQKEE